jgi:hypothetical protein
VTGLLNLLIKLSLCLTAHTHNPGKYDDDDLSNPGSLFIVQELVHGGNLLHKVRACTLAHTQWVPHTHIAAASLRRAKGTPFIFGGDSLGALFLGAAAFLGLHAAFLLPLGALIVVVVVVVV